MPDPNYIHLPGCALFLLPAKCANTSAKAAILRQLGRPVDTADPDWFVTIHAASTLPYVGRVQAARILATDPVPTIGFIRHPVPRLVSCWRDKVADVDWLEFRRHGKIYPRMPWEEFVQAVCSTPDSEADQHFRSMVVDLVIGEHRPDLFVSTHRIEKDWRRVEDCLGWEHRGIPRLNRCKRSAPIPHVTEAQSSAILDRYRADLVFRGALGL